ncbi:MAG: 16S rRNA (guanine(527)-N(7))-methyltransferase RsmG [Clostridiales bacterium]|nr:16S rRNA (guanine(527)-N(7))-methyltransferase RsmG [Clostridiales bacterium]
MTTAFREHLRRGAAAMRIELTDAQADMFLAYYRRIVEANAQFNLTRVPDDPAEFIDRNLLDSLAPLCFDMLPEGCSLIDVGTGAGFPGIPLAIARPDVSVTLVDALDKRVKFLQGVTDALHLNAEAVHMRAEDAARTPNMRESFDVATARAVAPVNVLAELLLPFVRPGGAMLAFKGPGAQEELEDARFAIETLGGGCVRLEQAGIPGRDWRHSLVLVEKAASTPEKYPRRAGMPEKRPLRT